MTDAQDGLDPARLRALAEGLGESPEVVARTLHDQLASARARIDAALGAGDLEATGDGAHAARNSALMVGARSLLTDLRALETAADHEQLADARAARRRAEAGLERLIEGLAAFR